MGTAAPGGAGNRDMSHRVLRAIELFAGAGGLALGTALAGFDHVALIERDASPCSTLRLNRSTWPVVQRDVCDVDFTRYTEADLLAGGAPCQPFSLAGRRRLDQDQRNLFPEVLRAIRDACPRALLLENVKGLLMGRARAYFDHVLGEIAALGYDVRWRLINCADYGVPQKRERVFIVGFQRALGIDWKWPAPTHQGRWRTVREALAGLPSPSNVTGRCEVPNHFANPGAKHYESRPDLEHELDAPAKTIRTGWQTVKLRDTDGRLRYLTLREVARLQTFPDTWKFAGSYDERLRQLGNAVPVDVACVLAAGIGHAVGDAACQTPP